MVAGVDAGWWWRVFLEHDRDLFTFQKMKKICLLFKLIAKRRINVVKKEKCTSNVVSEAAPNICKAPSITKSGAIARGSIMVQKERDAKENIFFSKGMIFWL